jgi:hypothetical protein
MLRTIWPVSLCVSAAMLGCDALPKLQFQLQGEIQREFHITKALIMTIDTTNLMVAIFDDARAELHPKALSAFHEDVASYAVTHYQKGRLKGVAVVVSRATRKAGPPPPQPEPVFFVTEYRPDGGVRLAPLRASSPADAP